MPEVDYGNIEFTVRRLQLHQLAEHAVTVIPSNPTQPVFGCFQVDVRPGFLQLAGTNMVRTVWASTEAVSTTGSARLYLPARKLRYMLAEAPEGEVTVKVRKNYATVTAGASANWSNRLPDSSQYPELVDLAGVPFEKVGVDPFLSALRTVRHAVGKDSGRPQYTQVSIAEGQGPIGQVMMATAWDSAQFARCPVPGFPFPVGIPDSVLDELVKLLASTPVEAAEVGRDGNALAFRVGPVTLAVVQLIKDFPDSGLPVRAPADGDHVFTVQRDDLRAAIRRVRINASTETSAVALVFDGATLSLMSKDEFDVASEAIPVTWAGGRRVLVVHHGFLASMLDAHPARECEFRIGPDKGKRRSALQLADEESGVVTTIPQMPPEWLGYGD
jgi:DNA polymerase III sliding clamp (beta) subunit (PCNA family)